MAAAASSSSQTALDNATRSSTSSWQADLKVLFDNSKDRFADVVWEFESDSNRPPEEVWGHKAMVYARAPPAFQQRYFAFRPAPVASPVPYSSSPHTFGPVSSVSLGIDLPPHSRSPSPYDTPGSPTPSTSLGPLLRLRPSIDSTLFANELEYLYTGIGFGAAFEFLFDAAGGGADALTRTDSMSVGDAEQLRVDKLRHDLNYMWRARLYSDVRISLTGNFSSTPANAEGSTAIFSAHRFVLASRSPYFRAQLLGGFAQPASATPGGPVTITLPSPPFTPASLHFTLGYLYTGTLVFSHRTYDLDTAFAIMRAAAYLQLPALHNEVEARIVEEMMHGLCLPYIPFAQYEQLTGGKWGAAGCKCRQCARRAPRVLTFAMEPDVKNAILENGARRTLSGLFGEGWCTSEFAALPVKVRSSLLSGLAKRTTPSNLFNLLAATQVAFKRLDKEQADIGKKRTASKDPSKKIDPKDLDESWIATMRDVILSARKVMDDCLCSRADEAFEQDDWLVLLEGDGVGFNDKDRVEGIMSALVRGLNDKNAGQVYQTLVDSVLARPHPADANTSILSASSPIRTIIEQTQRDILTWLKKHWTGVQQAAGFDHLAPWALNEIADVLEVQQEDLLSPGPAASSRGPPTRTGLRPIMPRSGADQDQDTASMASLRASVLNKNFQPKGDGSGSNSGSGTERERERLDTSSLHSVATASSRLSPVSPASPARIVPKQSVAARRSAATTVTPGESSRAKSLAASVDGLGAPSARSSKVSLRKISPNSASLSASVGPSSRPQSTLSMRSDATSAYKTAKTGPEGIRTRTTSMASTTSTVSVRPGAAQQAASSSTHLTPPAPRVRRASAASTTSVSSARSAVSTVSKSAAAAKKPVARGAPTPTRAAPTPTRAAPTPTAAARQRTLSSASSKSAKTPITPKKDAPPVPPVPPVKEERERPSAPPSPAPSVPKTPAKEKVKPVDEDVIMEEPPSAASTLRVKRKGSSDTITEANALTIRPGARPAGLTFEPEDSLSAPSAAAQAASGITLNVGIPCIISSKRTRFRAFARYIGEVAGEVGPWVGVEVPVGGSWGGDKLEGRAWHDGTWGGVRYFEVGNADWDETHRLGASSMMTAGGTLIARGVKREGDTLSIEQAKRFRSASPAMSDVSSAESRGLFVRPQQVLYVVDAEQD
ncbi:hypothetical protein EXIGLDRAFT_748683 [Exidia glandulosa HHB12029]|uniref:BTB domain-containing protein n=1 Tax=Exidia glandulosa HHB12029 TaxID=1314781 RepID=A0A165J5W8_EXIGL|nr:hypothetical protein EXIGLDRAFT_748683 [Exidia glandulosa HHB12029]